MEQYDKVNCIISKNSNHISNQELVDQINCKKTNKIKNPWLINNYKKSN